MAEDSTADVAAILVDGPDAAVVGRLGQTLRANGVNYSTEFVLYLAVADGLITRYHIEDTLAVKRAYEDV